MKECATRLAVAIAVALTLFSASVAHAADRNCTQRERTLANRQLWLNTRDKNRAIAANSLWTLPAQSRDGHERLLVQRNYVIGYDDDLRVPLWTMHRLDPDRLRSMDRVNCFRHDERLPGAARSRLVDYEEPTFDQGHLAPSADMEISVTANVNSFILSNMTPQYEGFNRGTWESLEEFVRDWAKSDGDLYVIAGAIFDRNGDGERDDDSHAERMRSDNRQQRVAIPTAFFKIIACQRSDGVIETLSIILEHDQQRRSGEEAYAYFSANVRTISEVESVTGLTFVPDRTNVIEASEIWAREGNGSRAAGQPICVQ